MRALYIGSLGVLGWMVGCAVVSGPSGNDTSTSGESALATTMAQTFVKVITPKCGPRLPCPAHILEDVKTGELTPIGKIDYGTLSDADVARLTSAAEGAVVLRGAIVPRGTLLPGFNVTEAYLGQPGASSGKSDVFYKGGDRNPLDPCVDAPCPEGSVTPLNTVDATPSSYSAIDVSAVDPSQARQDFLHAQVAWADAIVAGKLVSASVGGGLPAQTLRVSQVFRKMGTPPASRLTVDNTVLRDPNGNALTLRGWNWGQWGTYQPNDEVVNRAAQRANTVRIPLRWWGVYGDDAIDSMDLNSPQTGYIDAKHLAYLDMVVTRAAAQGLWVDLFVDSNCGQLSYAHDQDSVAKCGLTNPTDPHSQLSSFATNPDKAAKFRALWTFLVKHYKAFDYIGMYELLPEPHLGCSKPNKCEDTGAATAFYEPLIDAIRAVDSRTPLLVGPTGGYDVTAIDSSFISGTPADPNHAPTGIVYTGNFLDNAASHPEYVGTVVHFSSTHQVPVFVQQVGVRDADRTDADGGVQDASARRDTILDALGDAGIGWTWWTYREQHSGGVGYAPYWLDTDGGWQENESWLNGIAGHFTR